MKTFNGLQEQNLWVFHVIKVLFASETLEGSDENLFVKTLLEGSQNKKPFGCKKVSLRLGTLGGFNLKDLVILDLGVEPR